MRQDGATGETNATGARAAGLDEVEGVPGDDSPGIDPLEECRVRRCRVCGEWVPSSKQRYHAGRCARLWKTHLQRVRRERARHSRGRER